MEQCPDCFKEQRSANDQLKQTIFDAQKKTNRENKPVAILIDGTTVIITGAIPPGTRQIINPVQ
ncbi:MAG: hypothetical protein ACRC1V_11835 [Plesiomonas sp.]